MSWEVRREKRCFAYSAFQQTPGRETPSTQIEVNRILNVLKPEWSLPRATGSFRPTDGASGVDMTPGFWNAEALSFRLYLPRMQDLPEHTLGIPQEWAQRDTLPPRTVNTLRVVNDNLLSLRLTPSGIKEM
ncbi:hypothetical protein scyTo_0017992, partial [Scyliorhinus torazame]|nr:hypothetical protein [Scyliorhinus torazame]